MQENKISENSTYIFINRSLFAEILVKTDPTILERVVPHYHKGLDQNR